MTCGACMTMWPATSWDPCPLTAPLLAPLPASALARKHSQPLGLHQRGRASLPSCPGGWGSHGLPNLHIHVGPQILLALSERRGGSRLKESIGAPGIAQAVEGEPLPPLQEGESLPITEVDLKQVTFTKYPPCLVLSGVVSASCACWMSANHDRQ